MQQVHIFVSGRVQGIAYRYQTKKQAERLGIGGWVKNLSDGRVELMAIGKKDQINKLLRWLKSGHPLAKVEKLEITSAKQVSSTPEAIFKIEH